MAFVEKRSGVYLTIDETARVVRPLAKKPICKWVYNIPEASRLGPDRKKQILRGFKQIDQDHPIARLIKDAVDPLWELCDPRSQFKKSGERVDFPTKPTLILPVWSYADSDVKIIKQGSQLFDEMEKYDEAQGNIMSCDWTVWKKGSGFQTEYSSSRHDVSMFNVQPIDAVMAKATQLMDKALSDLFPFKTQEAFVKYVQGQAEQEAQSFPFGANQPATSNAPVAPPPNQAFVPGAAPAPLAGTFAAPPMAQPGVSANPFAPTAPAAPFAPAASAAPANPFAPTFAPPAAPVNGAPFGTPFAPPSGPINAPSPFAPTPVNQPGAPAVQTYPAPGQTVATGVVYPMPGQTVPTTQPAPTSPFAPTASAPAQGVPAANPFAPTQAPAAEVAPAPVHAQQFFPPPTSLQAPAAAQAPVAPTVPVAQPDTQDPASVVVQFGKYAGKTLGYIRDSGDLKYLPYLKSQVKDLARPIEQILAAAAQAPTTQNAPATAPAAAAPAGAEVQPQLVRECTGLIQQIPDFQGANMVNNLMPFLKNICGDTNYGNATVDKLTVLKSSLLQKLGQPAQVGV